MSTGISVDTQRIHLFFVSIEFIGCVMQSMKAFVKGTPIISMFLYAGSILEHAMLFLRIADMYSR